MIYTNSDSRLRSHPRLLRKPSRLKGAPAKAPLAQKKQASGIARRIAPLPFAAAVLLAVTSPASAHEVTILGISRIAASWPIGELSPATVVLVGLGLGAALYGTILSFLREPLS